MWKMTQEKTKEEELKEHWGKVIFNGYWTILEAEQCAEDILKAGRQEALEEIIRLKEELAKEIRWREFNILHEKEFRKSIRQETIDKFENILDCWFKEFGFGVFSYGEIMKLKQKLKEMK